jgi:protease I
MGQKKILMIIAPQNFRDEELFDTKAVLEKNGFAVTIASSKLGEARGMLGGKAKPEIFMRDVNVDEYQGVVFVGGMGSAVYFADQIAHKIAREASQKDKLVAAICIAPSILANAGLLKGKKVTCFSSETGNLRSKGAQFVGGSVQVDGKLVTAEGPTAAREFGEAIVKVLQG